MGTSTTTLVFATLLIINGAQVGLIGLAGLANGQVAVSAAALLICVVARRSYKSILRRYA